MPHGGICVLHMLHTGDTQSTVATLQTSREISTICSTR